MSTETCRSEGAPVPPPAGAPSAHGDYLNQLVSIALERAVQASALLRSVACVLEDEAVTLRGQGRRAEAYAAVALAGDIRRVAACRAMAEVAMPYLGGEWAVDVANNVIQIVIVAECAKDLEANIAAAIRHRVAHFCLAPLTDEDIAACADAMAAAWRSA